MKIEIPLAPMPQPRVRATMVAGRPRLYQPTSAAKWKKEARQLMTLALPTGTDYPVYSDGPLRLVVMFVTAMPKSYHRKTKPTPGGWHAKRPDLDNYLKAIKDAANGILWADDSQVSWCTTAKVEADQSEEACIRLWVGAAPEVAGSGKALETVREALGVRGR